MRPFFFVVPFLAACTETSLSTMCALDADGFDIEDVSSLEDAQSYIGMHDAVILEVNTSQLGQADSWRVKTVDILPMIPTEMFDFYFDGGNVTVEIWDGDDPTQSEPYRVTQTFSKDELQWEDRYLASPASTFYNDQKAAWWTFDFTDVIPTEGLTSDRYIVGVVWEDSFDPPLGYSNFNRPCDRNWTDYDDGSGWQLNEANDAGECSWPMLRVGLEVIEQAVTCSPGSTAVN